MNKNLSVTKLYTPKLQADNSKNLNVKNIIKNTIIESDFRT